MERSSKSNLSLFPSSKDQAERRQRQSIFTECGPAWSVAAKCSCGPHLLVTDIEAEHTQIGKSVSSGHHAHVH